MTETNKDDAMILAIQALGWVLDDDTRASRLLSLTGLEPDDMRARLTDPTLLDAVIGFLEAHEPDLIACAQVLSVKPEMLVDARRAMIA